MTDSPAIERVMQYTPDDLKPQAFVLQEVYGQTFEKIIYTLHAKNFTLEEREQVDLVGSKSYFTIGCPHSVSASRYNEPDNYYVFEASTDNMAEDPAIIAFVTAHEIEHARRREDMRAGARNTTFYVDLLHAPRREAIVQDKKATWQFRIAEALSEGPLESVRDYVDVAKAYMVMGFNIAETLVSFTAMQLLSHAVEPVAAIFSRREELHCDAFALRAYPETSLDDYHAYLKKHSAPTPISDFLRPQEKTNTLLLNFTQNLDNLICAATHPSPEQRYDHLNQLQQQMRLK